MKIRALLSLLILLSTVSAVWGSTPPSFELSFTFKPDYSVAADSSPGMWLDVCTDTKCTLVDASIPFGKCRAKKTTDADVINLTTCSIRASGDASDPDSNLALLSRAANLRLRVDNLTSSVFRFVGGAPSHPTRSYRFIIGGVPDGLVVVAQQ